jgi:nucleoside-diphosphate-sugar epimerase
MSQSVLITGAGGNLGRKLTGRLLAGGRYGRVLAVDRPGHAPAADDPRVSPVEADLKDVNDGRWRDALAGVDGVVHLAAQNPWPDAPWEDAAASFDMTANLVEAAAEAGVRRLVFASSNHVMGQYKDPPLADGLAAGGLRTDLPPGPGTRQFNGRQVVQPSAYATSKLMGERLCLARAALSRGAFTTVSLRIGWCQPGENLPETLSAAGVPGDAAAVDPDEARNLRWFRNMWLSNRDLMAVIERALLADAAGWPTPGIVVNAMSGNTNMPWDIEATRRLIGYQPQDNVWDHVS